MPDAQLEAARASKSTAVLTVPAYVHQWAEDPSAVEYLTTLQFLVSLSSLSLWMSAYTVT